MAKRTHKIRKALTDGRRTVIVQAIAEIARSDWRSGITETLMNHEGTMIATLRASMCLEGIGWRGAHEAAIEIVGEGLTRAGAKRPRWKEGQRDRVGMRPAGLVFTREASGIRRLVPG